MIKAIIFDYDGVIVDSFPTVHEVYQEICRDFGLFSCPDSLDEFRKKFGHDYLEAYQNLGVNASDYQRFGELFHQKILTKNPAMFEGTKEMLEKLAKDYTLLLITATSKAEALQKLSRYGLERFFRHIDGVEPGRKVRKTEHIERLFKELNIEKDETIYVGDRDVDYEVAQEAGIRH